MGESTEAAGAAVGDMGGSDLLEAATAMDEFSAAAF
jgi:hypothetical protein